MGEYIGDAGADSEGLRLGEGVLGTWKSMNGNNFVGDVLAGDKVLFFFEVGETFGDFFGDGFRPGDFDGSFDTLGVGNVSGVVFNISLNNGE